MAGRWTCLLAIGVTLALAACGDSPSQGYTEPQFANTPPDACGFSNTLINNYFTGNLGQPIRDLKLSMANAGLGTVGARNFGFEIMDSIGSLSRNPTVSTSPAAGAALTLALIPCMFANASTFTYPHQNDKAFDFTEALTSADGGAYFVRGGGTAGADSPGRSATVLGRTTPPGGVDGNLSGIMPSSGTWTTMLDDPAAANTSSEGRALIYGYLVSAPGDPILYEWATIPSELTFSPETLFAVCDNDVSDSAMVLVQDVGVLAYQPSVICNTPQSLTTIQSGWGPKALAARLGRVLMDAVTPAPLQAAALLSGTSGSGSRLPKSIVSKLSVSANEVNTLWVDKPPATIVGTASQTGNTVVGKTFPVSFKASVEGNSISGFCAYLVGTNNNGTNTTLIGPRDPACTNPPGGNLDALSVRVQSSNSATETLVNFGQCGVTKVGGIIFTGVVDILDRAGSGVIVAKSNVKPAK